MAIDPVPAVDEELAAHCQVVASRLRRGHVVPFLGAGANLCGRPEAAAWLEGYLPSGAELADYLAQEYGYPAGEEKDLLRVSQYVQAVTGGPVLYDELHRLFAGDYKPTKLHELLALLAGAVASRAHKDAESRNMLIVTTNYDDALEQAFVAAGHPFDLVVYMAKGPNRGKFIHRQPGEEPVVIDEPNTYRRLSLEMRPVIVKIHGAVVRNDRGEDSYVITEDNYIEYLAQSDVSNIIPAQLMAAMNESHFLFLGYSLKDWNLRVILQRIWGQQAFEDLYMSWAIQKDPSKLEERLWGKRNVEILDVDLELYVQVLRDHLFGAGDGVPSW